MQTDTHRHTNQLQPSGDAVRSVGPESSGVEHSDVEPASVARGCGQKCMHAEGRRHSWQCWDLWGSSAMTCVSKRETRMHDCVDSNRDVLDLAFRCLLRVLAWLWYTCMHVIMELSEQQIYRQRHTRRRGQMTCNN